MANAQILILVIAAMAAGIFLVRLYTVLGRRTGNERDAPDTWQRVGGAPDGKAVAKPAARLDAPKPSDPTAQALMAIKLADRRFETEKFLAGARQAYEIVVTAYARFDRAALRPLLSEEVYAAFDGAMRAREDKGEKTDFTFVGFREVRIVQALLKAAIAEITVEFAAQFKSATKDPAGNVVEGDTTLIRDVVDTWSFSRDVKGGNPNWTLVATAGPEAL